MKILGLLLLAALVGVAWHLGREWEHERVVRTLDRGWPR